MTTHTHVVFQRPTPSGRPTPPPKKRTPPPPWPPPTIFGRQDLWLAGAVFFFVFFLPAARPFWVGDQIQCGHPQNGALTGGNDQLPWGVLGTPRPSVVNRNHHPLDTDANHLKGWEKRCSWLPVNQTNPPKRHVCAVGKNKTKNSTPNQLPQKNMCTRS